MEEKHCRICSYYSRELEEMAQWWYKNKVDLFKLLQDKGKYGK